MKIYIAVTGDEYELPLFVADSAKEMAEWAGISVASVHQMCCRNMNKPPINTAKGGYVLGKRRIRKIVIEEDKMT